MPEIKSIEQIAAEYYKNQTPMTDEELDRPIEPVDVWCGMTYREFDAQMIADEHRAQFGSSFVLSEGQVEAL